MLKIIVSLFSMLLVSFSICCPAQAIEPSRALYEAQKFEAQGEYALAASAYLAVVEDFDFLPESNGTEAMSPEERILVGKCAIHCLEEGIQQYLNNPNHSSLSDCPELQLLDSACRTMLHLQPENPRWSSLQAQAKTLLVSH